MALWGTTADTDPLDGRRWVPRADDEPLDPLIMLAYVVVSAILATGVLFVVLITGFST